MKHARTAQLRQICLQLVEPRIAANGGHTVKTAGDGMLVEFSSAAAALRCSIDVQRAMQARNAHIPQDERIQFRIGINLGDIIVDGQDIAGDGVNIASRLESIAAPGEICVSSVVRDQVHGELDAHFIDMGEQRVKNVSRPIRVYRVTLTDGSRRIDSQGVRDLVKRNRRAVAALAFTGLVFVGLLCIKYVSEAAAGRHEPPLMSIAVMPFEPRDSVPDRHVTERITRDVTTALERRLRVGRVVSHGLATSHGNKTADPRAARNDLNVRYLVLGSVRHVGGSLEIDAQLIETASGVQIWSDHLSLGAISGSDAEFGGKLSNALIAAIVGAEAKRVSRLPKTSGEALDRVLRAYELWRLEPSLKGTLAARDLYEEALRLDPHLASALVGLGYTLQMQIVDDPAADRDALVKRMEDVSTRAVRADPDDPKVWSLRSAALGLQGRYSDAMEANSAALAIDPYSVPVLHDQASIFIQIGEPDAALRLLERSLAFDSRGYHAQTASLYMCRAYLALGSYRDATAACEKAVALGLDWWYAHLLLTAAYAQIGDAERAASEKAKLLEQRPDMSIARFKSLGASTNSNFSSRERFTASGAYGKPGCWRYRTDDRTWPVCDVADRPTPGIESHGTPDVRRIEADRVLPQQYSWRHP